MAITATELENWRDTLIRNRAKGIREAQVGDERIRFGTDSEMGAAIADLEARLRALTSRRPSAIKFSSSKGL